jgi:ABC-type polysaccharide/polyol phosphate export permease
MIVTFLPLMWKLLQSDLEIFTQTIGDKLIDLFIWIVTMVLVTNYLMPSFGLTTDYTGFMVASLVVSAGLFEVYGSVTTLISDFEGHDITSYYCTLPMPSYLVFIEKIAYYTINTCAMGILVLPISKLLAWNTLDLSQLHIGKFLLIFMLSNIFYASFTLWTTSRVKGMEQIGSVWMRFVYPLWFLGGFQYSWLVLYKFSPTLAYISLINPMVYVMEAARAAVLGQEGSLPYWACLGMLALFTVLCTWHGLTRLKKRLDYI